MEIMTASGAAHVNKRSPYGKWLQGWISAGGWSGWFTLQQAWKHAQEIKLNGVSWYALGRLMVIEQGFGAALQHKRDE